MSNNLKVTKAIPTIRRLDIKNLLDKHLPSVLYNLYGENTL